MGWGGDEGSVEGVKLQREDRISHNDRVKAFVDNAMKASIGQINNQSQAEELSPPIGLLQYEFYVEPSARDLFIAHFNMVKNRALGMGFALHS